MVMNIETKENMEISDNERKIIEQVEYYFGDINIRQDSFVKNQLKIHDGWFPLKTLMTFNRLKSLTEDQNVVIEALKKSQSGLLELSECQTKLKRVKPVPEFNEEYKSQLNKRTLHLKGFPKDTTLEDLKTFCREFGTVEGIEMRRFPDRQFKGCIMVVYANLEDAEKVLALEELKYKDVVLCKENKDRYFERKREYHNSRKEKKIERKRANIVKMKGAILKIRNAPANINVMDIKKELSNYSKVAFVAKPNDAGEIFIRFEETDGAKTTLKALSGDNDEKESENDVSSTSNPPINAEICGHKVEVCLPTEEEEVNYWNEYNSKTQKQGFKRSKSQRGKKRSNQESNDDDNEDDDVEAADNENGDDQNQGKDNSEPVTKKIKCDGDDGQKEK